MRIRRMVTGLAMGVLLVAASNAIAAGDDATDKTAVSTQKVQSVQTTCPVMGGKINTKVFADYDGKRVYFCCGGCPSEFKNDPTKYVKQLEDQGVALTKTPVKAEGGAKSEKTDGDKTTSEPTGHKGGGCCP